jgi:hypothetical protein
VGEGRARLLLLVLLLLLLSCEARTGPGMAMGEPPSTLEPGLLPPVLMLNLRAGPLEALVWPCRATSASSNSRGLLPLPEALVENDGPDEPKEPLRGDR